MREQALGAFEEATRIDDRLGSGLDAFVNVGKQLAMLGRLDAALKLLEARLPAQPNIEGHFIYGETLLKAGRFHEGWKHYEFRWMRGVQVFLRHKSRHPIWNGQDLRGKTILVLKEQGMGDTIQFVRYLPMLKQRGATVLLQKVPGFDRSFTGVDRIVELEDALEFDYYISLLSLPRVFGTDIDSIPQSVPYLHANADGVAHWAKQLGDRIALRVGLLWAGNPIHKRDSERSMSLESLAPLLEIPGAHFYSLQKGSGESQVDASPLKDRITPLGPQLKDFEDTAAVISLLDLVIGVDTAVAHLAGAMGKPMWLLVQKDGEWRWLTDDRTDSPWYPTMRIFRQSTLRNWRDTVQQVRIALEAVVDGIAPIEAGPAASNDGGALAIVNISPVECRQPRTGPP